MLTFQVETYDGGCYQLPMLLRWDLELTGGVPCDSLSVTCLYDKGMADVLPRATRFTAAWGGETMLRGVVDAYEISMSERGLLATVEGRGMAALLLDNESEAVTYERATLGEVLGGHVSPYGISVGRRQDVSGDGYVVTSGSSQWKALQGFTRRFGGFDPYFTREGTLMVEPLWGSGKTLQVDDGTPLLSLQKREQRYGVISEVLIQDKVQGISHSVENFTFLLNFGLLLLLYIFRKQSYFLYFPAEPEQGRRTAALADESSVKAAPFPLCGRSFISQSPLQISFSRVLQSARLRRRMTRHMSS